MNFRRILIVNDDGYDALGIQLLAKHFQAYGTVTVYAPASEHSGKSQAITCWQSIKCEAVLGRDYLCYKVYGTPADCVRLATGLYDDIDLVVSGINDGFNIGIDTLYSGTIGAATDANLHGIPSLAFSAPRGKVAEFENYLDQAIEKCFEIAKVLDTNLYCLNVNFPKDSHDVKGFMLTRVGYFVDDLTMVEYSDGFRAAKYNLDYDKNDLSIDYTAQQAGYISISPLTCDKTHLAQYALLNKKFKDKN